MNSEIYKEEEILNIINKTKYPLNQSNSQMNENRNYWLNKWFFKYNEQKWDIYFIKWLSKTKNIALLYFIDLKIELVAIIMNVESLTIKIKYNIRLIDYNKSEQLLSFTSITLVSLKKYHLPFAFFTNAV